MKNSLAFVSLAASLLLSSCVTTTKTARTAATSSSVNNVTVADLRVTDHRITYTMTPSKEIQRGGLANVKQAAIQEALTQNGNADLMVEPEFVLHIKKKFPFGTEVSSITVSGRPAYYENFRTLNDSVWGTPGFYGQSSRSATTTAGYRKFGLRASAGALLGKLGIGRHTADYGDTSLGISNTSSDISNTDDGSTRRTGLGFVVNAIGGYQRLHSTFDGPGWKHVDDYKSDGAGFLGALGTIGLQTSPKWFFGIGSGYMYGWDTKTHIVPVFGQVRYYFSKRNSSLFLDYKMGGSTEVSSEDLKGGLFIGSAIGYGTGAFEIAVQFLNQQFKDRYNSDWKHNSPHVGLAIGLKL